MPVERVVTVDKQGRVVLPKDIRDKYRFEPGTMLAVIETGDGIELKVAAKHVSLRDIFSRGLTFDAGKALAVDVANMDDGLDEAG